MARKTTTTTVVTSGKDENGNWEEYEKVVTTVVERDDEGYPYTSPFPYFSAHDRKQRYGSIGDYFGWYSSLRPRPKDDSQDS